MLIGNPTYSSFLHGAIAAVATALAWCAGYFLGVEWAAVFAGPLFFYGREMKEYQKRREQLGDGKDNQFQVQDFNPVRYSKSGRGDGFWDFIIPCIVCFLGAVVITTLRIVEVL